MNIEKMITELFERGFFVQQIDESSFSGLLRKKDANPSELVPQHYLFHVYLEQQFWHFQIMVWQRNSIIKATPNPQEILLAIENYFMMVDMYEEIIESIRFAVLDLQDHGFKVEIRSSDTLFVWGEQDKNEPKGALGSSFSVGLGKVINIFQQKERSKVLIKSIENPEDIVKTILMLSNPPSSSKEN